MYFGVAKDSITPPFPMPLACANGYVGNFHGIHDDVFVRCLVMDNGTEKTILMAFDLLFHDRTLNDPLEQYAAERYHVKPSAVIIAATHSHIAPAAAGYNQCYADPRYEAFLLERAKTCLDRAMCSLFEGTIEYTTFEAFFNISRRGCIDGKCRNFAGPTRRRDTEFSLLVVRSLFGDVRSVVMNYACHPVFYPANTAVSGEFPARVCQLVDAHYYGCTSLYLQSAGGDVRPAATVVDGNFTRPLPFSVVDRMANDMAESVIASVDKEHDTIELTLTSDAFSAELPMEPCSFGYFVDKIEDAKQYGAGNINYVNAVYIAAEGGYEKLAKSIALHCQTVKLTENLYLVAMGGEPTCLVKDCVKRCFPGKNVFFIGYTDCTAYIVTDHEIDEGGYESHDSHLEYRLIGPFKKGIDQKLTNGFTASFEKLK